MLFNILEYTLTAGMIVLVFWSVSDWVSPTYKRIIREHKYRRKLDRRIK